MSTSYKESLKKFRFSILCCFRSIKNFKYSFIISLQVNIDVKKGFYGSIIVWKQTFPENFWENFFCSLKVAKFELKALTILNIEFKLRLRVILKREALMSFGLKLLEHKPICLMRLREGENRKLESHPS